MDLKALALFDLKALGMTLLTLNIGFVAVCQSYSLDIKVTSITDTLDGGVGEIDRDIMGNLFVADFADKVWKITNTGEVSVYTDRMYGASGNTLDTQGHLYQAQYYGNAIVKINRYTGEVKEVANKGLSGPVGLTFRGKDLIVCNCNNNTVGKVIDGVVVIIAKGDLFNCPNGLDTDPNGNLYVVNYRNPNVVKIAPDGDISLFAKLPASSGGHIFHYKGNFFVTSFFDHKIFKVSNDGEVTHFAGTGEKGVVDGKAAEARFSNPNGIVAKNGKIYVNDKITYGDGRPNQSVIRMIQFPDFSMELGKALTKGGGTEAKKYYYAFKSHPLFRNDNTETELNAFGYRMLQQGEHDIAVTLFQLNVESYPNSFNVWDSLAEVYMATGDIKKAVIYYQKSLELNPENSNATKQIALLKK